MERILILGHNGFIGSYLMRALALKFPEVPLEGMSYSQIDLSDKQSIDMLIPRLGKGTTVILCAAIKRQFGDTLDSFEKNVAICMNLARAIEIASVGHLLFFSSMAVYGEDIHNMAIDEDTKIWPRSFYGLAKYTGEKILEKVMIRQEGIFTALRPPLIYGPGDEGNTYGPVGFLKKAMTEETIVLWGDGEELREFIFVEDATRVVTQILHDRFEGVLNLSAGRSYSFVDVLNILKEILPQGVKVESRSRTKEKVDNVCCNTKIREWMGDMRFTSLGEGIRKTYEQELMISGR
jgi:UDP-glucose 4-epimerase